MPLFNPPITIVAGEVPAGAVDDANTEFELAHSPIPGSVSVFKNGLLQQPGEDYSLSGTTVSFGEAPSTNVDNPPEDVILASYARYG